jgi:hypothetical protein
MVFVLSGPAIHADEQQHSLPAELRAEVPALEAFHEVMYELWHGAWPERDVTRITQLLPDVVQAADAIGEAPLPGILRDKQAAWDAEVAALNAAVESYREAAASGAEQQMLDAVEALHSHFEKLVRIIRPVMDELQSYHVVLYQVYHSDLPQGDTAALAKHSRELDQRCTELAAAAVPQRFAAIEGDLREAVTALCAATSNLQQAADAGGDQAGDAIETVHTRYQAVEGLFD